MSEFARVAPKGEAQQQFAELMKTKTVTFAVGSAGTGKAQPIDAMVKVPGGWTRMGNIKPGDDVTAADGSSAKVINVFPQGKKKIYRITFEDGAKTECCEDHLWQIENYAFKRILSTKQVIDLLENSKTYSKRLYVPLNSSEQHISHQDEQSLLIDPYILGVIIGDGCITQQSVMISTADAEMVHYVNNNAINGYDLRYRSGYDYCLTQGRTGGKPNYYKEQLKLLGLMGRSSKQKFIPDIYLNASHESRIALLQGLMDADGTVDHRYGTVSYCTSSPVLADDVQYLIRSLGGLCKIKEKYIRYKGELRKTFILNIRHTEPSTLFRLTRKKEKTNDNHQYSKCLRRRIKSIEYIGVKLAQCILIDHPDHLYITDDFIVTHNTFLALWQAITLLERDKNKKKGIKKIVCLRPMIAEQKIEMKLGALPGVVEDKVTPYNSGLIHNLERLVDPVRARKMIESKQVSFEAISLLRGSSFHNTFIIVDEAQLLSQDAHAMKLILTRIGEGSKLVILGDVVQSPLRIEESDLIHAIDTIGHLEDVGLVFLTESEDVHRSPIVREILHCYEDLDRYKGSLKGLLEKFGEKINGKSET